MFATLYKYLALFIIMIIIIFFLRRDCGLTAYNSTMVSPGIKVTVGNHSLLVIHNHWHACCSDDRKCPKSPSASTDFGAWYDDVAITRIRVLLTIF